MALPAVLALGACSNVAQQRDLTNVFRPYRIDVIQGNFVSKEMADELQPGMTQEQVRNILGTPLLQNVFHASQWEYVFSLRQGYQAPIVRRFMVFFDKDGKLVRTEGDPLPSETEFVAQINALRRGSKKPKVLTEAQLQAEIAAAQQELKARPPAPSASAASDPLVIVAPPSEISELSKLVEPAAAASSPAVPAPPASPASAASGANP